MRLCERDPVVLGPVPALVWRYLCGWGVRVLTLRLHYVAGYTDPLLFLFERTYNYYVDNQGLVSWRLRRLGKSRVRSSSYMRVLIYGRISCNTKTLSFVNSAHGIYDEYRMRWY